jgi:hypothetical protein
MDGPTVIDVPATVVARVAVSSAGGMIVGDGAKIVAPAGAVSDGTTLVVTRLDAPFFMNPYARPEPGAVSVIPIAHTYDLGPDGVQFAQPVAVSLPYDPARVPADTDPARIAVAYYTGTHWAVVPADVDLVAHTATVRLRGFEGEIVTVALVTLAVGTPVVFGAASWYYGAEGVDTDAIVEKQAAKWITPDDPTVDVAAGGATVEGVPLNDPAKVAQLLRKNTDPDKGQQISLPGPDGAPVSLYNRYSAGTGSNWQRPATYLSPARMRGDCTDVTNALVSVFRNLGYPAKSVFGYAEDTSHPHVWGEVRIGGEPYLIDDDGMLSPLESGLKSRNFIRPEPDDSRAAMWDENGQTAYEQSWWTKAPAVLIGRFDLASMMDEGADLTKLNDLVAENQVRITYDKGAGAPATAATVHGSFSFILVLDDAFWWSIQSGIGQDVFGVDPEPMPASWRGCSVTTEMRGQFVGAQTGPGEPTFKGTSSITATSDAQGCEKTGADIKSSPPRTLTKVPWTATGDETGLKGTIRPPANEDGSAGIPWRFVVRAP